LSFDVNAAPGSGCPPPGVLTDTSFMSPIGLVLSFILTALLAGNAAPAELVQISSDPFTNSDSQHATQVEPGSFSYGSTVVAAFQSGRFFNAGASGIGFATSQDNGLSWNSGVLPRLTAHSDLPGPYDRASDPSVAYDAAHDVWMIATLGLSEIGSQVSGAGVLVSRSTDGGLTWASPVTVSAAIGGSDYDKPWIACDNWPSSPHYGNCYATWDDFARGDRLLMSTSSDGGQSWGVKKSPALAPKGLGGIPLPQPSGTVIVPASNATGTRLIAFRSTDGGRKWTKTQAIANVNAHRVAGNLRVLAALASAGADASGKAYVVWADCRFRARCRSNDLVMSTSVDGVRWTRPRRIPIDPTTSTADHFLPGLAVDRATSGSTARLSLTYYYYPDASCTETSCQLLVGFVFSADGGATWSAPQTLSEPISLTWLPDTSQGRMVGDYISTSLVSSGEAVPVFALADPPAGGVFDEAIFAGSVALAPAAVAASRPTESDEPILATESDHAGPGQPLKVR
jgi:hypothetical protein